MGRRVLNLALRTAAIIVLGLVPTVGDPPGAGASGAGVRLSGVDFLTGYKTLAQDAAEFRRIKADGANTVSFDVWWEVPGSSSSVVVPEPGATDSDGDLLAAAQEARLAGLNVTLTPKIVIAPNLDNGGWRGEYNPRDPAAFFSSYQSMVDHYASLAQQAGMSMFLVGSEMTDSDGYVSYWRQVIASARQRFEGPIGYEVDWREIPQFSWGNDVDVLLLSAYFPLSNEAYPTLAELEAGWHDYRAPGASQTQDAFAEVAGFAQRWGKPIIFGEAGYTATTYPANQPWWNAPDAAAPELQYLAYRALLDTFVGQQWWGGVLWWAWNDSDPRSPENKPAESLIGVQSLALSGGPGGTRAASASPGPPGPQNGGQPLPVSGGSADQAAGAAGSPGAGGTGSPAADGGLALSPDRPPPSPPGGISRGRSQAPATKVGLVALSQPAGGADGAAAGLALGVLGAVVLAAASLWRLWRSARRGTRSHPVALVRR